MLAADGCASSSGNPACCFCSVRAPGGPGVAIATSGTLMPLIGSSGESLADDYGRWVIAIERGRPTERLDLEPLAVAHATG